MRKMLRGMIVGMFVLLVASSARAQAPPSATDITAAQVQAFIKDAPHDRNSDRPMRVIDVGGYRIGIFGVFRPKSAPPNATVHQTNITETYYMLEGAGTLVTGGTLRQPPTPPPPTLAHWPNLGGTAIKAPPSRRIPKADIVSTPVGV